MTVLKSFGIVVGTFLLLGFVFIEPAKQMPQQAAAMYVPVGVLACGALAWYLIRRIIRNGKTAGDRYPGR